MTRRRLTFPNSLGPPPSGIPDASPIGASGDTADAVAYPTIHYAGSDDPLVASDVTEYNTTSGVNHNVGPPIQMPIAVTTVGQAAASMTFTSGRRRILPSAAAAYPIGGFTMALLYTCYADQPVIDALVAPFSAPDPGYFTWVFGTATQNGNVPNFVLAQKGPSAIPAAWETAAKKLILTDTRTKIRKGARYGLSGRKPRLLDGNWRLDKICVLPTRCPAASSRCAQIQAGSAQ